MTVSMRVMSAGDGCRYLLRTVSAGDGNRSMGTPLTRYYAETGTPPGYWLGSGVAAIGSGCHLGGGIAGWWLGRRSLGPLVTKEELLRQRARREAREESKKGPPQSADGP